MLDNKMILLAIARHLYPERGYFIHDLRGSPIVVCKIHGYLQTFDPAQSAEQLVKMESRLAECGRLTLTNFAGEPVASLAPFETKNGRSLFMKSRSTMPEAVAGVYYEYFQDEL